METITLNNGVEMPALGLGVFQTPPDETRDAVRSALGAGYRLIDTAAAYGNEREVGEAVQSSELPRSEVFLETKAWISDYGYEETLQLVEGASTVWADFSIDDYAERTKATIAGWRSMNGQQGGDPAKLAAALVTIAGLDEKSLRWMAGADSVDSTDCGGLNWPTSV
jgi:aryl-alcohol dehydrogenase-like predicted oxidoreductase